MRKKCQEQLTEQNTRTEERKFSTRLKAISVAEAPITALQRMQLHAYRGRKERKRDFRKLWIARISAAVQAEGLNYSQFMHGLKLANIDLNRKALSNMAIEDKAAFSALVAQVKTVLA